MNHLSCLYHLAPQWKAMAYATVMLVLSWHGAMAQQLVEGTPLRTQVFEKHYGSEQGLSSEVVYHMYQDSRGFLWVAGSGGLDVFDGFVFRHIPNQKYPGLSVGGISEDTNGIIYCNGFRGEVFMVHHDSLVPLPDSLPCSSDKPFYYHMPNGQTIALGFQQGYIKNHNWQKLSMARRPKGFCVDDASGQFFIKSGSSMVAYGAKGKVLRAYGGFDFLENKITLMASLGSSSFAFLSTLSQQVYVFYQGKHRLIYQLPAPALIVHKFARGVLVGTKSGFVQLFITPQGQLTQAKHYLPGEQVMALYPTDNGQVWAATHSGKLIRLFTNLHYLPQHALSPGLTTHLLPLPRGGFLAANNHSMLQYVSPNNTIKTLINKPGNQFTLALFSQNDSIAWMSGAGLWQINTRLPAITNQLPRQSGVDNILTHKGQNYFSVWAGIYKFTPTHNLKHTPIRTRCRYLTPMGDGQWLGLHNGDPLIINLNTFTEKEANIDSDKTKFALATKIGHYIWLADKQAKHLFVLRNNLSILEKIDTPPSCTSITQMLFFKDYLLLTTKNQLLVYDTLQKTFFEPEIAPGFSLHRIFDVKKTANSVLVAAKAGVFNLPDSLFDRPIKKTAQSQQVFINQIFVDGTLSSDSSLLNLTNPGPELTIKFGVPALNQYKKPPVYYKLTRHHQHINKISGQNRSLTISSLPWGSYSLILSTSPNLNNSIEIPIKVAPPLWAQPAIWVLTLVAVLGIGVLITYFVYKQQYQKQQKQNRAQLQHQMLINNKLAADLASIKAQINPHFIFNCLNSIQKYILTSERFEASRYLNMFSNLMRKALSHSRQNVIALTDEVAALKDYIELEKMRLNGNLRYQINLSKTIDAQATTIPPMLVQPFVENAIIHGLTPLKNNRQLMVRFIATGPNLVIEIDDNGVGFDGNQKLNTKGNQFAVKATSKRLEIINQLQIANVHLQITNKATQNPNSRGVLVRLTLANGLANPNAL